jgi:hypothetical protein
LRLDAALFGIQSTLTMAIQNELWTARQWLDRAEESRARADEMSDRHAKATMLRIAALYQTMADRLAVREREGWGARPPESSTRPH